MTTDFGRFQKQAADLSKPDELDQLAEHRLNILIADDDMQNQRMMELILRRTGHVVKFASNGVEAVQMATSGEFDLVLMDIQMPLLDGLDATRQIRKWEDGEKRVAIIGLTAVLETEHKRCIQAGMDSVISKPFEIEEFYEVLTAFTNQKTFDAKKPTSTNDDQPAKMLILDVQGSVKRFAGDTENYTMLLDEFILSLSGKFEELKAECETGNWQDLSNHAHNLKGLSANFGAMELSRKARELDEFVDESRYDQAKRKLDEIDISIQNLRTEALAFLRKHSNDKGKSI